jgi:hypothetical protein
LLDVVILRERLSPVNTPFPQLDEKKFTGRRGEDGEEKHGEGKDAGCAENDGNQR